MSTEGVKSRGLDGHWDEDEIEHVPNGAEVNAVWKESEFQVPRAPSGMTEGEYIELPLHLDRFWRMCDPNHGSFRSDEAGSVTVSWEELMHTCEKIRGNCVVVVADISCEDERRRGDRCRRHSSPGRPI